MVKQQTLQTIKRSNGYYVFFRPCLDQVRPWLHGACPVVSALRDGHVPHQQVGGQVTGSEGQVGSLQEGESGNTAGTALLLTDDKPVGMETPAGVQVEV